MSQSLTQIVFQILNQSMIRKSLRWSTLERAKLNSKQRKKFEGSVAIIVELEKLVQLLLRDF